MENIMRACADDLACAVHDINILKDISKIFNKLALAANLKLKIKKCRLVVTSGRLSMHLISVIKEWLCKHVPEWAGMSIVDQAVYLGVLMGPGADESQFWGGTSLKYLDRAHELALSRASTQLLIPAYHSKVFSIFSHLGQFLHPSRSVLTIEKRAIHSVLKLPYNTLDVNTAFGLEEIGGSRIRSLSQTSIAAMARFFRAHKDSFEKAFQKLSRAYDTQLCQALQDIGKMHLRSWGLPPFLCELRAAFYSFPRAIREQVAPPKNRWFQSLPWRRPCTDA
eukprot:7512623-Karenia_brevis.AAC.1